MYGYGLVVKDVEGPYYSDIRSILSRGKLRMSGNDGVVLCPAKTWKGPRDEVGGMRYKIDVNRLPSSPKPMPVNSNLIFEYSFPVSVA